MEIPGEGTPLQHFSMTWGFEAIPKAARIKMQVLKKFKMFSVSQSGFDGCMAQFLSRAAFAGADKK